LLLASNFIEHFQLLMHYYLQCSTSSFTSRDIFSWCCDYAVWFINLQFCPHITFSFWQCTNLF